MAEYIGMNCYIKPTYIVQLPEYTGGRSVRSKKQRANEANLKENRHKGDLSKKSQRKLLNAVNWLVVSAKQKRLYHKKTQKTFFFKINFITLTFPVISSGLVSERQAKRAIHALMSYSRKYFYLRNYVWKFERTEKGQLHCHITTDTFIYYKRLRSAWNGILKREGLLEEFFAITGHYNPNSTDIHAVHKVKDIGAYIAKYMAKNEKQLNDFKGRIWASNKEISEVNSCSCTIFAGHHDKSEQVFNDKETDYKPIFSVPDGLGNCKEIGQIFFTNERVWQRLQGSLIKDTYDIHRFHIRNNIEKPPDSYFESFLNEFFQTYDNDKNKFQNGSQGQPPNGSLYKSVPLQRPRNDLPSQTSMAQILFKHA